MTEIQNPFLTTYNTPHQTTPFHLIKTEHYEPAIEKSMEEQTGFLIQDHDVKLYGYCADCREKES